MNLLKLKSDCCIPWLKTLQQCPTPLSIGGKVHAVFSQAPVPPLTSSPLLFLATLAPFSLDVWGSFLLKNILFCLDNSPPRYPHGSLSSPPVLTQLSLSEAFPENTIPNFFFNCRCPELSCSRSSIHSPQALNQHCLCQDPSLYSI